MLFLPQKRCSKFAENNRKPLTVREDFKKNSGLSPTLFVNDAMNYKKNAKLPLNQKNQK